MRQGQIVVGAGALTALVVLAAPQVVSAHNADVIKACDHLDVSVGLFDESVQTRVTIDGSTTVHSGNGHWVFPWSETEVHSYTVVVDAVNPADDDKTFTGEQQPCIAPANSATSTTPTTTTVPETTTTALETTTTQAGTPTTESTTSATPITQNLATPTIRGSGSGGPSGSGGGSGSSGGNALPSTGPNDTAPFIAAGIGALAGGSVLVFVGRRGTRRGTSS